MKKYNFILFCKTYADDFTIFKNLKESIDKFNVENIPFYIVCPKNDIELFSKLKTEKERYEFKILSDEKILNIDKHHKQNWNTQQLIKMNFYKTNLCNFFLIIDSDSYFIKEFYESDFMYDKNTPYIVMNENKNFNDICIMLDTDNVDKMGAIIKNYFKRNGKNYRFLTTPIVFSTKVLEELNKKEKFENLLELSPLEAYWHGEFILHSNIIDFKPCEPFFKCFNYQFEYDFYKKNGIIESDLAKNYSGIVMQNGWIKEKKYKPSIFYKIKKKIRKISFHLDSDRRCLKYLKLRTRIKLYIKFYTLSLIKIIFK